MGGAEAFEFAGEFRVVGEVVEFVRIGLAVVEFFVGLGGVEEFFGVGLELSGFVKGSQFLHGDTLFGSLHVLVESFEGLVIADVFEALVPDHADDIVALVHAVAGTVDEVTGGRYLAT